MHARYVCMHAKDAFVCLSRTFVQKKVDKRVGYIVALRSDKDGTVLIIHFRGIMHSIDGRGSHRGFLLCFFSSSAASKR